MSVFRCGCPIIDGICTHHCALAKPEDQATMTWTPEWWVEPRLPVAVPPKRASLRAVGCEIPEEPEP